MARPWMTLLLLVFLTSTSIAITVTETSRTKPTWPPRFPIPESFDSTDYQNQTLNRTFCCSNSYYSDIEFNLTELPNCGTKLSQDLYGWGVRIGFYATWLASLFANFFDCNEIRSAVDANSIFLFALEVSVVKATFHDRDIMKVDALILFLIGYGTAIGAVSLWGRRTKFWYTGERRTVAESFSGVGIYARLLLCFFLGLYGVWFWYDPIKPGLLRGSSCDPRCRGAFIFGIKLSRIHWFFFTFALISELYWAGMIFLAFVCCFSPLRESWKDRYSRIQDRFSRIVVGTGLSNLPIEWAAVILPAVNLAWYILIITIIEVTLHQNRAIGTLVTAKASTSPAQLIPFLIGLVSLVRLIWLEFVGKDNPLFENLNPFFVEEKNPGHSSAYLLGGVGADSHGPHAAGSK